MQRWEYKSVLRTRGWPAPKKNEAFVSGGSWNVDLESIFALGNEGWELVSIVPISNVQGNKQTWWGAGGETSDFAGFTNEQLWVFKRPA